MSRRVRRTGLAALAATGALLLSACDFSVYSLPLPGGTDVGDNPIHVTVMFRDVLDLVPQSSVKVDDVAVGKVEHVEHVELQGYTAKVSLALRNDVKLPGNALAEIRQTSLLGEKFVSLKPPGHDPSSDELSEGDVIPLSRSGDNPEIEEVLGALSLILNGGGVAQLKTITTELNTAFDGRESTVRSVLNQLRLLMSQLDEGRTQIVTALERVNHLSASLNEHSDDIDQALDQLPAAVRSIDSQRQGLVRMLKALDRLGAVGTRVINASKEGTIDSINALAPTLAELEKAGDDLPRSLQIVLTYPFVNAVVGTNPTQARDLHMGDYENLSIKLELDLRKGIPSVGLPVPGSPSLPTIPLPNLPLPNLHLPDLGVPGLGGGTSGGTGGGLLGGLGGSLGLGRAPVGPDVSARPERSASAAGVNTGLGALLTWGVVHR